MPGAIATRLGSRRNIMPETDHRCPECSERMLYVDGYRVCPRGHGRLIPTPKQEISERLTIKQNDWRGFRMPEGSP